MYHILVMGMLQRPGNLVRDLERVFDGQAGFASDALAERFPGHIGHDVVEQPLGFACGEDRHDIRMREVRREIDLSQKTLASEPRADVRIEDLDGDLPIGVLLACEIHDSHASALEDTLQGVASRQAAL